MSSAAGIFYIARGNGPGMSAFADIFGNGRDRPPAPEVATPEDVEEYNLNFLQSNPQYTTEQRATEGDPTESPFAVKKNAIDDTKHKAEFPWLYDPQRGVRWDFNPIELRNLAQGNTWIGMLVQSITKETAQVPFTITDADDAAETAKRLETHPEERTPIQKDLPDATAEQIFELLQDPNPDDNWHDTVEMWLADLLEVGSLSAIKAFPKRAYTGTELTADPGSIEPLAIQTSSPEIWTKDYREKTGILDGYWQFDRTSRPGSGARDSSGRGSRGGTQPVFFETSELIWDDMNPRSNRRYGMPPTLLVKEFLRSLELAVTQEQEYLSRGSIPSGAWVFEEWDREEVKEWKTENEENIKGKPHKSLMFAGRGGDVRFEAMSMNFKELQFTERMQWYARVISSVFQVPTAVVGIEPEQINYHTFQGERENFENNTLGPYLQMLERVINDQVIKPHWGTDYRFEFKPGMSESTRGLISDRVRSEFNDGLVTRNEARRELGREPVDDDEDGFKDDVTDEPAESPAMFSADEGADTDTEAVEKESESREDEDEPLRNTQAWQQFDVQTSDVDDFQGEISTEVAALFNDLLADDELLDAVERFAVDDSDGDGELEKSLNRLTQRIRELIDNHEVASSIADTVEEWRDEKAREAVQNAASETDADIDPDPVVDRLQERDTAFADAFANRMADDIRETVADGWEEGMNSFELREEVAQVGQISEGWNGAEKIARQELQIATGEARNEFAEQAGKVEVWHTTGGSSGDGRNRDAHLEMHGKWKLPSESFEVDYDRRGTKKENVPGDSEPGIGCRCFVELRDLEDVDPADHGGVSG